MSGQFHIQAVSVNGSTLAGVRSQSTIRGWSHVAGHNSGTVHETLHYKAKSNPSAEVSTVQVGTWLAFLTGSADAPCVAITAMLMFGGKAASDLVGYESGTVHEKWTATAGLLYMTGLEWSDGDAAILSCRAAFRSSAGGTDPLTHAAAALPALPIPAEEWTITGMTAGGVAVPNLRRVSLSVDPKVVQKGDAGLPYPTQVYGAGTNGPVEIRCTFDTLDIGALGSSLAVGDLVITLTQYAQGGILSGTTKTITLHNCMFADASGALSGQQGSECVRTWEAYPRFDGTNKPMTIA